MNKLQQNPQPRLQRSCEQELRTTSQSTAARSYPPLDGFPERESGLAKMEVVLSGYRELKELRQRARAALQSATDKHEAFGANRAGTAWRHCKSITSASDQPLRLLQIILTAVGLPCWPGCEEVEELRAQVQDLDRRCAEQLPAVRAVAKRLQELRAMS